MSSGPLPLVLGAVVLSACPFALVVVSRWALRREAERTAAATFEADFIPENADVAAQEAALAEAERVVLAQEMCDLLDDALEHLEGLR